MFVTGRKFAYYKEIKGRKESYWDQGSKWNGTTPLEFWKANQI